MRSSTLTATVLSLGAIAGVPTAHADDTTVLDTMTGSSVGALPVFCEAGLINVHVAGSTAAFDSVKGGLGVVVHASVKMTLTRIQARFAATSDTNLATGPGTFTVADRATGKQLWATNVGWNTNSDPGAVVSIPNSNLVLERGKDYVISYVGWNPPLLIALPGPTPVTTRVPGDPLCIQYASIPQVPTPSPLLQPVGYGHVRFDPVLSDDAHQPAWGLDEAPRATPVAALKIDAEVDTDEDNVIDDADNCAAVANESQDDFDFDGVGDACDNCKSIYNPDQSACGGGGGGGGGANPDRDGDGVFDVRDNCPFEVNAGQLDADHDGVGDACDGTDNTAGCSTGGASPSLLFALVALAIRRRRR